MPTSLLQKVGYPLFNGRYYSFNSIETFLGAVPAPQVAFTAINWKNALKPGMGRGTTPRKLIRTRGDLEPSADFEMYLHAYEAFKATLVLQGGGGVLGYGEVEWNMRVMFREAPALPIAVYEFRACRIVEEDYSNTQGTDPTKVKVTLDVMDILTNGHSIVGLLDPSLI